MTEPRVEQFGDATLYLSDNSEVMNEMTGVDCIITSPPYAQQRDYGDSARILDWDMMMKGCFRNFKGANKCQVLVNLGQIHRDGEVIHYWERWRDFMRSKGWRFFGQYVWDQGFGLPGDWNGRLAPSHEYVLHFNRQAIQPNKWVATNLIYGKSSIDGHGKGLRGKDGVVRPKSSPDLYGQPYKIADSVIRVVRQMARGGPEGEHPALFPLRFAEHLLASFTSPGQTVCDPYMGSGTVGEACAVLGRKFIGIEIEEKYFDIACRRIELAMNQQRIPLE